MGFFDSFSTRNNIRGPLVTWQLIMGQLLRSGGYPTGFAHKYFLGTTIGPWLVTTVSNLHQRVQTLSTLLSL